MAGNIRIRLATAADAPSVLEIYAPFITDTAITFENEVPGEEEFAERMEAVQQKYPWLVCEDCGNIVGYAYASRFQQRAAYEWSAALSVYIRPGFHGRKIGKALYFTLLELLKLQGFCNAVAIVTLPNGESEDFHRSVGFRPIGIFQKAGYKLGSWHDVIWFGLNIQAHPQTPKRPMAVGEIQNTPAFDAIIQKAERMITV